MSRHLLLKISGSIACYKSAYLASEFIKRGWQVKVVMTESALKFVGQATFEGLTGEKVYQDLWQGAMDHIDLDRWADVVLLCPASANTLNKIAVGRADNLLSNLYLAHDFDRPYFIAPAMNTKMWEHPATRESICRLEQQGAIILSPEQGSLACGETGDGRLLEPDKIIETVIKQQENTRKILVTFGGTKEPIDGVRVLTNSSSGATGNQICKTLFSNGYKVTAVFASGIENIRAHKKISFGSADDLEEILKKELKSANYEAVIHCAAISDFRIENSQKNTKISSTEKMSIHLKPREKTISFLRGWSKNKDTRILGFKMTVGANLEQQRELAMKMIGSGHADAVIVNDAEFITQDKHKYGLVSGQDTVSCGDTKVQLAETVNRWVGDIS